jgi:DNA-binding protein HU-beta
VNKSELVQTVASSSGADKRSVEGVLGAFFDTVKTQTKSGDKVAWPGFGSFQASQRGARTGRNPRTGEPVKIKASTGMKFTPSSTLKEFLNTKGSPKKAAKKTTAKKTAAGSTSTATAKRAGAAKATTKAASAGTSAGRATAKSAAAKATTAKGAAKKSTARKAAKR